MKSNLTKQRIKMKAPERAKNHILYGWDGWGETRPPLIYRLKRISPTRYEDDIVDVDNDKWSASASEAEPERKQLDERLINLYHQRLRYIL